MTLEVTEGQAAMILDAIDRWANHLAYVAISDEWLDNHHDAAIHGHEAQRLATLHQDLRKQWGLTDASH